MQDSFRVCAIALAVLGLCGCETVTRNVESAMSWMNRKVTGLQMKQDKDGLPTKAEVTRVLSGNQELALVPTIRCVEDEANLSATAEAPYEVSNRATIAKGPNGSTAPAGNSFSIELSGFDRVESEQKNAEWCWAACVEMALKQQRVSIKPSTQQDIAATYRAESTDQTGNYALILRALRPDYQNALSGKMFVPTVLVPPTADMIVHRLGQGEAVIAGIGADPNAPAGGGHAVVIIGCTFSVRERSSWGEFVDRTRDGAQLDYHKDTDNRVALHSVTYFDPWPGDGEKTISAKELNERIIFLASHGYAAHVIQNTLKSNR